MADTPAGQLSGGEKARLLLGLATFAGPHLVILDEPTNHLDIDSRAALIEAINDYPGAVILVSHDRHLIEACADRLWLVANGRSSPFDGDLDDYQQLVLTQRGANGTNAESRGERGPSRLGRADLRRAAAEKARRARPPAPPHRRRGSRGRPPECGDRADRRGARRLRAVRARSGESRGARQGARRSRVRACPGGGRLARGERTGGGSSSGSVTGIPMGVSTGRARGPAASGPLDSNIRKMSPPKRMRMFSVGPLGAGRLLRRGLLRLSGRGRRTGRPLDRDQATADKAVNPR